MSTTTHCKSASVPARLSVGDSLSASCPLVPLRVMSVVTNANYTSSPTITSKTATATATGPGRSFAVGRSSTQNGQREEKRSPSPPQATASSSISGSRICTAMRDYRLDTSYENCERGGHNDQKLYQARDMRGNFEDKLRKVWQGRLWLSDQPLFGYATFHLG